MVYPLNRLVKDAHVLASGLRVVARRFQHSSSVWHESYKVVSCIQTTRDDVYVFSLWHKPSIDVRWKLCKLPPLSLCQTSRPGRKHIMHYIACNISGRVYWRRYSETPTGRGRRFYESHDVTGNLHAKRKKISLIIDGGVLVQNVVVLSVWPKTLNFYAGVWGANRLQDGHWVLKRSEQNNERIPFVM